MKSINWLKLQYNKELFRRAYNDGTCTNRTTGKFKVVDSSLDNIEEEYELENIPLDFNLVAIEHRIFHSYEVSQIILDSNIHFKFLDQDVKIPALTLLWHGPTPIKYYDAAWRSVDGLLMVERYIMSMDNVEIPCLIASDYDLNNDATKYKLNFKLLFKQNCMIYKKDVSYTNLYYVTSLGSFTKAAIAIKNS